MKMTASFQVALAAWKVSAGTYFGESEGFVDQASRSRPKRPPRTHAGKALLFVPPINSGKTNPA